MAPQPPITELTEADAWQLLGSAPVGRLATVMDRQPDVFPVNFVLDGDSVIFRTAEGSKFLQLIVNSRVAFEADGWDQTDGWSVVIKGAAHEVTDKDDLTRIARLHLKPWVQTVKSHVIRIAADEIEGRRFRFGEEPEPEPDYTTG